MDASAHLLAALQNRDIRQANELLAEYQSIDTNIHDESGRTPLHLAASLGNTAAACSLVSALAGRGAKLDVPNAHGTSAPELALNPGLPRYPTSAVFVWARSAAPKGSARK